MKSNKTGITITLVVYFVFIALLSVCTFVIPFPKIDKAVLIASYVCAVVRTVIEGTLAFLLLFKEENRNQKILGLPLLYSGLIVWVLQLIATIVFYLCNAFILLPIWIVIVVECILYGYFAIQLVLGLFFKSRNEDYHKNIANTNFRDEFRARLKALAETNPNQGVEKPLQDLLDTANASDPVTNDKTVDLENELLSDLKELEKAFESGSDQSESSLILKTKNTLLKRNALCKLGK